MRLFQIIVILLMCVSFNAFARHAQKAPENKNIKLLKEMFSQMVEKKDLKKIPVFYAPNFIMTSNGVRIPYKQYYQDHIAPYHSKNEYSVIYDTSSLMGTKNMVAGRMFVVIKKPGEKPQPIELMLIGRVNDKNQFDRMWVVNHPPSHEVTPVAQHGTKPRLDQQGGH